MDMTSDPLELIPCPFDPVHMVQRKRMQYHIMKCQKNVDMTKFRKCPFNAQHIILVEEYEDHVRMCEGRAVVENEMIYQERIRDPEIAQARGNLDVPQSDWVVPETTENWDDDDFTVVVGSTKTHPVPPPRMVERQRGPAATRLPLKGQSESSKVFDYSVGAQNPTPKAMVGRGRGRGYGLVKRVNDRPGASKFPPREPSPSTSEAPTESEAGSLTVEGKRAKDIRKLKKMLRQIDKIEHKHALGEELNADQMDKLERKGDVLASLELLNGQ